MTKLLPGILLACSLISAGPKLLEAQPAAEPAVNVDVWRTSADRTRLLAHERLEVRAPVPGNPDATIVVDPARSYQAVDGFGFALTGGSAQLLHHMHAPARHALLRELFGSRPGEDAISYLRVSVGASDMNDHVYTYDDMPQGESDPGLDHFSLKEDTTDVIPILREVLAINPRIGILASPWTAPAWMKTNGQVKAGSLRPEFYPVYAAYLVRYLESMAKAGVPIRALTMQNEPENPKNTPSMVMTASEEDAFLRDALGPALRAAGLTTEVVLYDHNCDHPQYPMSILRDPKAAEYAAGSGFHLYAGDLSAMSEVHDAFPDKALYFTEQMVVEHTVDGVLEPVARPVARILIGAMRNWSRTVLLWNLAADPNFGPHTNDGGCPVCQGAITIDGDQVTRNIALDAIAQVSRFVPPGSVRVDSGAGDGDLADVAWRTPSGNLALVVTNTGAAGRTVQVKAGPVSFRTTLAAGEVATFTW